MIKLFKNAKVYAPNNLGKNDVLVVGDKIAKIHPNIESEPFFYDENVVEIVEADGLILIPGLIDCHVHLLGGGGEGGYKTRTPELMLSDLILGGTTTVVGCLGTDGVTRSMESLVAKAYGLREEGVSAYVYSGSYRLPLTTITGSIQKDIMMVEPIIGIGEIAISDHRSASPTFEELAKAASDARVGGILSGKSGLVNIHLGDGKDMMRYLFEMRTRTELPYTQFLPTHANRNQVLFEEAIRYAKEGGFIDFTTSTVPQFVKEGEIPAASAFCRCLEEGVNATQITFSSDGQGSLPNFDKHGTLIGLDIGKTTSLYETLKTLVVEMNRPIDEALMPVTVNPATLLKLSRKGKIETGFDADLVLIDQSNMEIHSVYALGQTMMRNGVLIKKGTFEK
ncbi:MAG TPA: beta-aspartyl-peptidase [Clostridiales bacterium UBA8960]|jgi:beta-aspartyl-dipeptidase (metallo-type)|nr:beta-aspartyl-peptidase [Clostridiales bacterium UBA8960]